MKYRKITAFMTALLVMTGACSCGSTDTPEEENINGTVTGEIEPGTDSDEENTEGNNENGSAPTEAAASNGSDETDKTVTSADPTENGGSDTTTTAAGNQSSGNTGGGGSSSGGNTGSGGGSSSGGNTGGGGGSSSGGNTGSGGGSSSGGNTGSGGGSSSGNTGGGSSSGDDQNKSYMAEITLGSTASFKGSNVAVSGSKVTISAGGDYLIKGSASDGQVIVDTETEEKVKIILSGVDLSCSSGPAIFINEAKRCTIELADGTTSNLRDGGKDKINDGVIFSNDTLRIKGSGTLNITSGNAHGIASDDDVIIESGTYNITSIKSGIFAHDDITINGGSLNVKGGTNGIKSKGTIHINGGSSVISGGTKEEKSSVYAAGQFSYTGGYLFAAGNKVSPPTSSSNPYIVVDMGGAASAGSSVSMLLNGREMTSFTPHNDFLCLIMLAPEIKEGSSFSLKINGSSKGEFTVGSGQNLFKAK